MPGDLLEIFHRLLAHFGPRHWWPAKTPFEVIVGAILTQAVAWYNVEKAITCLEEAGLLTPEALYRCPTERLETMIRATRYYREKAKKIKAFLTYLFQNHGGDLDRMFRLPPDRLRRELLEIYGIGEETADSILLYAGGFPFFVVDSYTKRIFSRLGLLPEKAGYRMVQDFFQTRLPKDPQLFNEYHAQLDALGHYLCKARPLCPECPLLDLCAYARENRENKKRP
ncbi:MAG: endonuclease III domain-containing protein [Firmicutes bacterium]|nr:endonuclease III domain-containing protein [Bacillota bacterium]